MSTTSECILQVSLCEPDTHRAFVPSEGSGLYFETEQSDLMEVIDLVSGHPHEEDICLTIENMSGQLALLRHFPVEGSVFVEVREGTPQVCAQLQLYHPLTNGELEDFVLGLERTAAEKLRHGVRHVRLSVEQHITTLRRD